MVTSNTPATGTPAKAEAAGEGPERIEESTCFTPRVDIVETGEAFIFRVDLPGVKAGDVDLTCEEGVLTLDAKVPPRQARETEFLRREYAVGDYRRSFQIGDAVKPDAITAELKSGVLTLTLPKAEGAKTRRIEIKSG